MGQTEMRIGYAASATGVHGLFLAFVRSARVPRRIRDNGINRCMPTRCSIGTISVRLGSTVDVVGAVTGASDRIRSCGLRTFNRGSDARERFGAAPLSNPPSMSVQSPRPRSAFVRLGAGSSIFGKGVMATGQAIEHSQQRPESWR